MGSYRVGVFPKQDGERSDRAYLRDYNPAWKGCIEVTVEANSGTEAKRLAIEKVCRKPADQMSDFRPLTSQEQEARLRIPIDDENQIDRMSGELSHASGCKCHGQTFCPNATFAGYDDDQPEFESDAG